VVQKVKESKISIKCLEILALVEPKGHSDALVAVDYVLRRLPRSSFYVFITDLETSNIDDFQEAASRAVAAGNKITIISPLGRPYLNPRKSYQM